MAIDIVDFPINSMVIFHCNVSSPEGSSDYTTLHSFIHWGLFHDPRTGNPVLNQPGLNRMIEDDRGILNAAQLCLLVYNPI